MDFKAISKTYFHKIKSSTGIKTKFGKKFEEYNPFGYGQDAEYEFMFFNKPLAIMDFKKWIENKKDIKSVLEIGCSTGLFPRIFPELFKNLEYTGIDISKKSIDICKQHLDSEFICGDFLKMDLDKKYDLIFSFHVIDHVADIDLFIKKILGDSKKYAYVNSYRGYFPELNNHQTQYRDDHGIYYNNISRKQIEKIILQNNISKNNFKIYPQIERNKIFYDSDLGRMWEHSNIEQKENIVKISGLSQNVLNNLPLGLEINTNVLDSCKGLDKILAKKIGFESDEKQLVDNTTIEICKK